MTTSAFDKIGGIAGKGQKADYQYLIRFSQCFQKPIQSFVWQKVIFSCISTVQENFLMSNYPLSKLYVIFIKLKIVVCKLFQFRNVKNLSFGKGTTCTSLIWLVGCIGV